MKLVSIMNSLVAASMFLAVGCSKKSDEPDKPADVVAHKSEELSDPSDGKPGTFVGTIVATTNAGRYVYLEIEKKGADEKKVWVAVTKIEAKAGDTVTVVDAVLMTDFYSPTLKRTFKSIFFTGTVMPGDLVDQPAQGCPTETGKSSGGMGKFYAVGTNSPHGNPHANPHGK